MRLAPFCLVGLVLPTAAVALFHSPAHAVGTRTFDLDTLEEFSGGDLKGVSVSSDGIVRAGWTLGNVALPDATAVFCSLAMDDDSVLVGTSPGGKVLRVSGDQAKVYAETGELAVTALAQGPKGIVYAAAMPGGKIFKLVDGKKPELLTTLPDTDQIWSLATDKAKTALYAATGGSEGKVFRIDAGGASSVYFKSDEPHLVSLAVGDGGMVYAGSSGKGLLYRIAGPGRATVVYDFPGEEVKAIALGANGSVFAVANEYGDPPDAGRRSPNAGRAQPGPATSTRMRPGKGVLFHFDASGRPEQLMHHTEFHYLSLMIDAAGVAFVGTGAEGRIYSVTNDHVVTLVADTDSRQIGALGLSKNGKPFVVAGDPAAFHRVVAQGGADAIWTSKTLDAGLRARFGHLSWVTSGGVELSTRTGNTSAPDTTWSPWSNGMTAPGVVASPQGRYVQVRARWSKADATLSEVVLPFVTDNARPVVLEVTAHQKGVTRDTKEGATASGGEPPKHDSQVHVSWRVDNVDADPLRYRLAYKREGDVAWREILRSDEVLTKTDYEWETSALPEGKYRVRVDASDEGANPPGVAEHHALVSSLVLVDNTPPVFNGLAIAGRRLRGRVVDGLGPIARVEIAIDGHTDWRPIAAADGIFDTENETLDADISSLVPPGAHIVAVRAFDSAGNFVVADLVVN